MSSDTRRVSFFVDGFNLYHSLKAAERELRGIQLKWLDLNGLCASYLHEIGGGAELEQVHYFSAYAEHLQQKAPDKITRHKAFVRALTATQVQAHMSPFRRKDVWDMDKEVWIHAYEEKETDVRLACLVLKQASENCYDFAVVVTGDSDFVPLYSTFCEMFPEKKLRFAFPYARMSKELKRLAPESFSISKEAYLKHQFPAKVRLPSNKYVTIPTDWRSL